MKGSITKKGSKYYPVIYLGKDELTDKKKYKWGKGQVLRREAERILNDMVRDYHINNDNGILSLDFTFSELAKEWLLVSKKKHAPKTYQMYEGNVRFVNEIFGDVKVDAIKTIHVQRYINTLNGSYSKINKRYLAIRSVMNYAVKMKLILVNPCIGVELPKKDKTEFNTWTSEDVRYFLDCLENDNSKWYLPVCVMLTTGMRPGEVCGLKYCDFSEDNTALYVRRGMQNDGTTGNTKNEQSKRKVIITNKLCDAIKKQQEWQKDMSREFEDEYSISDFICTHELGQVIRPDVLGRAFKKLIKKYHMPKIRPYDCRHSFATLMLKNGINPKIVSEMLGHKSIEETLNTYSHVLPDIQEEAVSKFERIVLQEPQDNVVFISS
ncbi:site-specific integrase [Vallitalea pronyensis]|uniref:Site-specific integrase n=1 Tax=Vallitalea pronyensis TaxID=1348613 RepID=A0A8J8MNY2_9FIRM|nr:site-specific integrase [Vallitalea pronyensis]QUI24906.1 site-specific integrase [Vallitalea pronyensis]